MYTFPELLKQIREEGSLTQSDLAHVLDVSTVLISMIETGQKDVSKNFVVKLADKLGVRPSSIMPFVLADDYMSSQGLSSPEKALIEVGAKLQAYLIKVRSKQLKRYV